MTAPPLVRPITLRSYRADAGDRTVSWLELFFDLVFAATVAQVAAPLSHDPSLPNTARFVGYFLLVWWAWHGHTTFATRFHTDDLVHRAFTLVQMFLVAVMGINAGQAFDARESAGFAAAYAVFRLLLVVQYLRAWRLTSTRPVSTIYLVGCGLAAVLWLVSAFAPVDARLVIWTAAFVIDAVTPIAGEHYSCCLPPDPYHYPERFGLFTIILVGESVVAVVNGMGAQEEWSVRAAMTALGGLALLLSIWWWYFEGTATTTARHVRTIGDASRLRVWTFAHLPLYLGIVLAGVAIEEAIRTANAGASPWPQWSRIGLAVAMIVMAIGSVDLASPRPRGVGPVLVDETPASVGHPNREHA